MTATPRPAPIATHPTPTTHQSPIARTHGKEQFSVIIAEIGAGKAFLTNFQTWGEAELSLMWWALLACEAIAPLETQARFRAARCSIENVQQVKDAKKSGKGG